MRFVRILFAAPLLAASIAFAGDPRIVTGRVVGISDGDTITVLDDDKRQHKIRLSGIDAPEKGQAFGERSRQNLAELVHGKDARSECHKVDRFKREVCKVWVQPLDCPSCGKTLDVGLAQISVGLAWWYRRYADEQSAEDRGRYKSEEEEAQDVADILAPPPSGGWIAYLVNRRVNSPKNDDTKLIEPEPA